MNKKIVLVSGMSGAGKTNTAGVLEDMGYHCVDNFPIQLLSSFISVIESTNDQRYNNVALSTSAVDFSECFHIISASNIDVRVLFLDAGNDVLLHRYKSTRRMHPLLVNNYCNTLEEAISIERQMFLNYRDFATEIIDTTFLKPYDLKNRIEGYFAVSNQPTFSISFISFGYKTGVPLDSDCMFDVRFLPNPFWEVELRSYSGDDKCVYDYVMTKDETIEYVKRLEDFLDYSFEQYIKEGKNHITVSIGCTGGQHRSVSIVNYLFDHYKKSYRCHKQHRDKKEVYND